ncbi:MAG: hypothetical protein ABIX12_12140 [Rubrivivax sp.]
MASTDRYVPDTEAVIYWSFTPPSPQQRRVLLETLTATLSRQIGFSLRNYSPLRSEHEIDMLRQNLRQDDVSQEVTQIRLIIRVAQAMPALKAWRSLSDRLVRRGPPGFECFEWVRDTQAVDRDAADNAKAAMLATLVEACSSWSGDGQLQPRDILPRSAMSWFDLPGTALTASAVRELGRYALRVLGQYNSLRVTGPETFAELVQLMRSLESDTYICAVRDRSGNLVLKTQLHRPSQREEDRIVDWLNFAVDWSVVSDHDGSVKDAVLAAKWKIYQHSAGLTSIFLAGVIGELMQHPSTLQLVPPYYGEGLHDPAQRVPRLPLPRDAKYPNVLTKMRAFEGEEFDTPAQAGVLKLVDVELESCRAVVTAAGLTTVDGIQLNNDTMAHAMRSGRYLVYVLDVHGNLYIGADKTVQHSSFLHQVADAGQMTFDNDGGVTLNPWSGHMTPDEVNTRQTEHCLTQQGLTNVRVVVIPTWD